MYHERSNWRIRAVGKYQKWFCGLQHFCQTAYMLHILGVIKGLTKPAGNAGIVKFVNNGVKESNPEGLSRSWRSFAASASASYASDLSSQFFTTTLPTHFQGDKTSWAQSQRDVYTRNSGGQHHRLKNTSPFSLTPSFKTFSDSRFWDSHSAHSYKPKWITVTLLTTS